MEVFIINSKDIEGRIDPIPYHPIRMAQLAKVKNYSGSIKRLEEIADFCQIIVTKNSRNFPYVGLENIESGSGELKNLKNKEKFSSAVFFEEDLILFPKLRPYLNKVFYANIKGIASTEFYVLKAKNCVSKYLYYFLQSDTIVNQTTYLMTGNTLPRLQTENVKKLLIPIPERIIQEKIIQIMDDAYFKKKQNGEKAEKIYNSINEYLLKELGIKKVSLEIKNHFSINSKYLCNKRIDPFYHQPIFEENTQSIKNRRYDLLHINQITKLVTSGQRPKGGVKNISEGIPSLGGEHINELGFVEQNELKYIPIEFHEAHLNSKIFPKDILLVKDGATTGKVGFVPENYPFTEVNINEHLFLIRIKKEYDPFYIFCFLKTSFAQIQIKREITGATITGLVRDSIDNFLIPIPQLEIQKKISAEIKSKIAMAEKLKIEGRRYVEKAKKEVEKILFK